MEPAGTASWKVLADAQAEAYKILMESFDGARVRPRAYISWQSDPLKDRVYGDRVYGDRVYEQSWPGRSEAVDRGERNVVYVGDGHMKLRSQCGSYQVRIRSL